MRAIRSVQWDVTARLWSLLRVDYHGGTFAEATGHRIGKAMAAELATARGRLPPRCTNMALSPTIRILSSSTSMWVWRLANPEFPSKTAALKYWLRHGRYGLTLTENNVQEIVGWLTLLILWSCRSSNLEPDAQ